MKAPTCVAVKPKIEEKNALSSSLDIMPEPENFLVECYLFDRFSLTVGFLIYLPLLFIT